VVYTGGKDEIRADIDGPQRNPPQQIRLRFREPQGRPIESIEINGNGWQQFKGEWVELPGTIGHAVVKARFAPRKD